MVTTKSASDSKKPAVAKKAVAKKKPAIKKAAPIHPKNCTNTCGTWNRSASSPRLEPETTRTEISRPYILTIENISYEYIKGFSLNNLAQALKGEGFDKRIAISYGLAGFTYLDFLRWFDSHRVTIGKIRKDSLMEYEKYSQIQLNIPMSMVNKNIEGRMFGKPVVFYMLLNQSLISARESKCDFDMFGGEWDIVTDLMPEAKMRICLYPTKVISLGSKDKELALPEPRI